jgi:hypothetical protein
MADIKWLAGMLQGREVESVRIACPDGTPRGDFFHLVIAPGDGGFDLITISKFGSDVVDSYVTAEAAKARGARYAAPFLAARGAR